MLSGGTLVNPFDTIEFPAGSTLIVAVSGGSDSTALLHLLNQHIDRSAAAPRLIAATVDHGLRAGSAEEARAVAAMCRQLGIEHHVLDWTGKKPPSGIQNAARVARHALLADLARQTGAGAVLVGHTLDDQAETVLMRRARGEGAGLAGIAPATLFRRQVWFMRPLLGTRRGALRAYLKGRGVAWADDPSNDNADFERVAVRRMLAAAPDGEAQLTSAAATADAGARRRLAVARDAAAILRRYASYDGSAFRLGREALAAPPEGAAGSLHALRILLAAAGGSDFLPDQPRSAKLWEQMRDAPAGSRSSLSRAVLEATAGFISIRRESRRGAHAPATDLPSPWGQFLPVFELEPATALAGVTGDPAPPPLPFTLSGENAGR